MLVHNADSAAIFDEIADRLELHSDNLFCIRACRRAVRTVGTFKLRLKSLIETGMALQNSVLAVISRKIFVKLLRRALVRN
jgi:DNA polymerase (family 10)